MKNRVISLLLILVLCISFASCGEAKRPIDYPDTAWICEKENIRFSVSNDGKITNATMVDKNGETISISLSFSDIEESTVTVTAPDGNEKYFSGDCTYKNDMFSIIITDIYSPNIQLSSTRLTFERS